MCKRENLSTVTYNAFPSPRGWVPVDPARVSHFTWPTARNGHYVKYRTLYSPASKPFYRWTVFFARKPLHFSVDATGSELKLPTYTDLYTFIHIYYARRAHPITDHTFTFLPVPPG